MKHDCIAEIKLSQANQERFNRLEAGDRLPDTDVAGIRDEVVKLILLASENPYVSCSSPEREAWVKRSLDYTGHIVEILERNHFRDDR